MIITKRFSENAAERFERSPNGSCNSTICPTSIQKSPKNSFEMTIQKEPKTNQTSKKQYQTPNLKKFKSKKSKISCEQEKPKPDQKQENQCYPCRKIFFMNNLR